MKSFAIILKSIALSLLLATSAYAADKVNINTADAATIAPTPKTPATVTAATARRHDHRVEGREPRSVRPASAAGGIDPGDGTSGVSSQSS